MKKIVMSFYFGLLGFYLSAQPVGVDNVGIGIINPTLARFQVNGVSGSGTTSAIFGGDGTGISLQRNSPAVGFNQYRDALTGNGKYIANGFAFTQTLDHNTGFMYFDMYPSGAANTALPAGTRSITISDMATVGIRTVPANATLYLTKSGNLTGAAIIGGTVYNSYFYFGNEETTYIQGGKQSSRVLINDNNPGSIVFGGGNTLVGINNPFPAATLDIKQVSGKGLILIDPVHNFDNWEYHVGLYQNPPESDLKMYSNETFVSFFSAVYGYYSPLTSDRRIKTNIRAIPSVLNKLMQLQPKEYEMKDFNTSHEKTFGFIAQDIDQLYPEFVHVQQVAVDSANRIPDLYSLNYAGFDVIAIKGLQEQYQQLKDLEKKNIALLKRLSELEKKLEGK